MAELESLVKAELQSCPWIALWAFRIGLDQIQQAGFPEAVQRYCRRKDSTRPRTEHGSGPAPAQAESGRLITFRRDLPA